MKKGKFVGAGLLLCAAVALCLWSALHKPKGEDISCPQEIRTEMEQVVQEMITSGKNHSWNLSTDYWVKQPTKKELRRLLVDTGLGFRKPKKIEFTSDSAVRASEDFSRMKLSGSFIKEKPVAIVFEKMDGKYKISSIFRQI